MLISQFQNVNSESQRKIPISVAIAFLALHSVLGAVLFSYWLDELPFITAMYFRYAVLQLRVYSQRIYVAFVFSFVSITTIGFGDVIVSPQNNFDTAILTFYLVGGIVIMTTFITGVVDHVLWIHYLGRYVISSLTLECLL